LTDVSYGATFNNLSYFRVENVSDKNTGEGCLFKSLTPQELKKLKDSIVEEDMATFERLVDENPRYC
jgi:hypothetical protein